MIGSLLALLPLILGSVSSQRQLLSYTPYPLFHIPPFEAWVAIPFFGILSPFLVSRVFSHDSLS
jgi:hypothetical protein